MPLGVLGDVDKQAVCGYLKPLAAYKAGRIQLARIQLEQTFFRVLQSGIEALKQIFEAGPRLRLVFQRLQLRFREFVALQIGKQPIDTSGDVPEVEPERRRVADLLPDLLWR